MHHLLAVEIHRRPWLVWQIMRTTWPRSGDTVLWRWAAILMGILRNQLAWKTRARFLSFGQSFAGVGGQRTRFAECGVRTLCGLGLRFGLVQVQTSLRYSSASP